jgi:hypothetical protein
MKTEWLAQDTMKKKALWTGYLLARVIAMIMMFLIAYMGFVSFFFLAIVTVCSFVIALFSDTLCAWTDDLPLQLITWVYYIPFLELLISLNY